MLPKEEIERYRAVLLALQQKVADQIEALAADCEPVAPDRALGRLTRTDAMQDQQMALHQRKRLRNQQTRIKTAMERIETGAFGICMACKEPMDPRRLEMVPDSPLCVACLEKRNR